MMCSCKRATYAYFIIPFNLATYGGLTYTLGIKLFTLPMISYTFAITVLAFYALARVEMFRTVPSYLGWAGVKLFMLVDFFIVCNETWSGEEAQFSGSVLTMTYYLAQLGIATSVFFC
ncbi:unnamed protein product [Lymnaea stagnalis]|uniref:lysoplasmalogenase n=1 Tax=Lymnaea stagnalis TaxID=6523 RepID=A0AAV2H2C7_LYMST